MRPDCTWSMSTAGLTAQEIYLPAESPFPFLRGSYFHSMAGSRPSWTQRHHLDNLYFSMDPTHMEPDNLRSQLPLPPSLSLERQKHSPGAHRLPPKKSKPTQLSLLSGFEPLPSSPSEDDQVVPSFQRLSVYERSSPPQTPGRCAKPLPPLPPPSRTDLSADQAMDNEVEFFTSSDDSRCLVPEQQWPKQSGFRCGVSSRRSFRACGQINYAYFEGPTAGPARQQQQQQQPRQPEVREPPEQQQQPVERPAAVVCQRQQERAQRKLRRSHSGPAGSFNKPTSQRLSCRHSHAQAHGMDKPEVPPRAPIPPRPVKTADIRRWSVEVSSGAYSDEDRPPKVPPRDPLCQGSSRTPSPKSLPSYLNGVMPPTQSFAPDPKYVSRGLQRQNSEGSPCILPVMENGKKSSTTHYFLLPQRPAYLDRPHLDKPYLEKILQDIDSQGSARGHGGQGSSSEWDCQTRRKTHVDIV